MTREEALDKLCHSYSGYFDVVRHEEPKGYLVAEAGLHIHSEKYVLVKAAKLWEADNNEYVYISSAPVLTKEIFEQCREQARADGMQRIEPGPNHMCSYITAIFLCDTCEPDALRALRRTRIYKSFKLVPRLDGLPHRRRGAQHRQNGCQWQRTQYSTVVEDNTV